MPTHVCPICRATYDAPDEQIGEPCPSCWKKGWRKDSGGNLYFDRVSAEARIWTDGLEQLERAGDMLVVIGAAK